MCQAFRQFGPVLMVPAAWTTAILAVNTEILPDQGLLIAHIVMSVLMTVFLLTGWKQMKEGVLKAWRTVITIGLPVTVLGALGLTEIQTELFTAVSLLGWMILPGLALVYTGKKDESFGTGYTVSGLLSLLGLYLFTVSLVYPAGQKLLSVSGLFAVLLGQSAGIFLAAYQNYGPE